MNAVLRVDDKLLFGISSFVLDVLEGITEEELLDVELSLAVML